MSLLGQIAYCLLLLKLESRMHRLERRMAVKKRRDVNEGYDEILEEKDLKQATPKRYLMVK